MGGTSSAEKADKTPKAQEEPTTREIVPPAGASAAQEEAPKAPEQAPSPPSPMQAKEPAQPAAAPSKPASVEPKAPTPAPDLSAEDEKKAAPAPSAPEAKAEPSKAAAKAKPQAVPPGPVDPTTTPVQVVPPPPKKDVSGDGKGKGKRAPSAPGTQLCVKNLSKEMTPEQLKALFEPLGTVVDVQAKTTKEGKVRGVCFVTMSTAAEASKALAEVNGKEVEGSKLEVSLAEARESKGKGKADADGKGGKGKGKGKADDRGKGKGAKGKGKGKEGTQQAVPTQQDYMNAYFPYGYPGMSPYGYMPRMPTMPYSYPGALPTGAAMPYGYGMYPHAMTQGLAEQHAMAAAVLAQAHAAQQAAGMQAHAAQQAAGMQAQLPPQPPQEEYEGSLKSLSQSNGYGFIACEETHTKYKRDVYVDKTLLPEGCKVADRLKFTISLNHKGHPRAESVTLAAA